MMGERHLPLVVVDRPGVPGHAVEVDLEGVGYLATRHLVDHGHRDIGLISLDASVSNVRPVEAGYRKALHEADLDGRGSASPGSAAGRSTTATPVPRACWRERPTDRARRDLRPHRHGCRAGRPAAAAPIPDDVALVGVDDVPARCRELSLTASRCRRASWGRGDDALERIWAEEAGTPRHVLLEARLVIRESCGRHASRSFALGVPTACKEAHDEAHDARVHLRISMSRSRHRGDGPRRRGLDVARPPPGGLRSRYPVQRAAASGATKATATPVASPSGPTPVVVDADLSFDDILALVHLPPFAAVDVRFVTVTGTGLVHCPPGLQVMARLLATLERPDVPVSCGRDEPLAATTRSRRAWRETADDAYGLALETASVRTHPRPLPSCSSRSPIPPPTRSRSWRSAHSRPRRRAGRRSVARSRIARIVEMGGAIDVTGNVATDPAGIGTPGPASGTSTRTRRRPMPSSAPRSRSRSSRSTRRTTCPSTRRSSARSRPITRRPARMSATSCSHAWG